MLKELIAAREQELAMDQQDLTLTDPRDLTTTTALTRKIRADRATLQQHLDRLHVMEATRLATDMNASLPLPDNSAPDLEPKVITQLFNKSVADPYEAVADFKRFFTENPGNEKTMRTALGLLLHGDAKSHYNRLLDIYPFPQVLQNLATKYGTKITVQKAAAELHAFTWDTKTDFNAAMTTWEMLYFEANRANPHSLSVEAVEASKQLAIRNLLPPVQRNALNKAMLDSQLQGKMWSSQDMIRHVQNVYVGLQPGSQHMVVANSEAPVLDDADEEDTMDDEVDEVAANLGAPSYSHAPDGRGRQRQKDPRKGIEKRRSQSSDRQKKFREEMTNSFRGLHDALKKQLPSSRTPSQERARATTASIPQPAATTTQPGVTIAKTTRSSSPGFMFSFPKDKFALRNRSPSPQYKGKMDTFVVEAIQQVQMKPATPSKN